MEVLYVSSLCSERMSDCLFRTAKIGSSIAAQRFHWLLAKGFVLNGNGISTISSAPVSKISHSRVFWKGEKEKSDGIEYCYLPFVNISFLRQVSIFFGSFLMTIIWILRHKGEDRLIVCDALNISITTSALLAANIFKIHVTGIVTDHPNMMVTNEENNKFFDSMSPVIYKKILNYFSSYVFLTRQLSEIININKKPECIIEGIVDATMKFNQPEKHDSLRYVLYAGGLYAEYGLDRLIEAFRQIKDDDLRLCIYGYGKMEKEMEHYMKLDNRLHYFGNAIHSDVLKAELKSTLLVNPRLSGAEFTKYSFPSKIIEYMTSGVPVLTTCLPGIPEEYHEFVYLFKDESTEGLARTLSYVLSLPAEELSSKGKAAQEFVLRKKNNICQAMIIIEMVAQSKKYNYESCHN